MAEQQKLTAKTKVLIIYTGGTIGAVPSVEGNPNSPLVPATKERFEKILPGLGEKEGIGFDIKGLLDENGKPVKPLDSSSVNSEHWGYMASMIGTHYNDYDGFVVLHGTDTMAFTASALSFMLENLAKPVVVTGSQLPIFETRTDATQNLINALLIAGYKATGLPLVPEVVICFADRLLRGNRTRKVSTTAWAGFDTPNYPHLGSIGEHIKINTDVLRQPANNDRHPFRAHKRMVKDVMDIAVFPGMTAEQLRQILELKGLKGIVFRTFGAGNAPEDDNFLSVIEEATRDEKNQRTILNVTQCNQGMVEMGLYAASSGLLERGVISGLDMTPEAALTKMMYTLSTQRGDDIQLELQQNLRGEQSENLFELRYGKSLNSPATQYAELSERPPGPFKKDELRRAILRVSGVGVENKKPEEPVCIHTFIGLPEKMDDMSVSEYAGEMTVPYAGEKDTVLLLDITETLKKVYTKDGSPIYVSLKSDEKFWFRGLFVTLFAQAT